MTLIKKGDWLKGYGQQQQLQNTFKYLKSGSIIKTFFGFRKKTET